jgi:flavorubredoxin
MSRLLVVHHTPSPGLQEMFQAAVSGARTDEVVGVEVVVRPALTASEVDVLAADGFLLGTPANIGYMSGALKHFFDGIYYPCLEATKRRPYGLYVHGNLDTTGAVRAVESIATGLGWRAIRPPVTVTGPPSKKDLEACWELGALLAAEVAGPLRRAGWSPYVHLSVAQSQRHSPPSSCVCGGIPGPTIRT